MGPSGLISIASADSAPRAGQISSLIGTFVWQGCYYLPMSTVPSAMLTSRADENPQNFTKLTVFLSHAHSAIHRIHYLHVGDLTWQL